MQRVTERLTEDEMFNKFPNQWLYITEPEIGEKTNQLITGIVVVNSQSRDVMVKKSKNIAGSYAIRFTGSYVIPETRSSLISYSLKSDE